jgi:hypothetical protein
MCAGKEENKDEKTQPDLTSISNILAQPPTQPEVTGAQKAALPSPAPTNLVKDQPPRTENDSQNRVNSVNDCSLPQDLKNKLEELEIPLDAKVRKAISRHHISQAYGAAAHVERTRATIDNLQRV